MIFRLPLLILSLFAGNALGQSAVPQTGAPGAVKATTRILPDGSRATNVVNPDKREAMETVADANGKVMRKTWFSLDERDFTTGAVHYDAKGTVRYKEAFKRDAADRISATYLYSKDDKLLGHRIFHYDAKGNVSHIDDFDAAGRPIAKAVAAPDKKSGRRRR